MGALPPELKTEISRVQLNVQLITRHSLSSLEIRGFFSNQPTITTCSKRGDSAVVTYLLILINSCTCWCCFCALHYRHLSRCTVDSCQWNVSPHPHHNRLTLVSDIECHLRNALTHSRYQPNPTQPDAAMVKQQKCSLMIYILFTASALHG